MKKSVGVLITWYLKHHKNTTRGVNTDHRDFDAFNKYNNVGLYDSIQCEAIIAKPLIPLIVVKPVKIIAGDYKSDILAWQSRGDKLLLHKFCSYTLSKTMNQIIVHWQEP